MGRLLISTGPCEAKAAVTRIGGWPLAPEGSTWPKCAKCQKAMLFLAQIRLYEAGDPEVADGLLLLWQCAHTDNTCEQWLPDSGGNHARTTPAKALAVLHPPFGPTQLPYVEGTSIVSFQDAHGYADVRDHYRGRVLGQLGGTPSWVYGDHTPVCTCGRRMRFIVQLEEHGGGGLRFGGGGWGYGFVCSACPDQARFMWQR
jgi:hypothetical protein